MTSQDFRQLRCDPDARVGLSARPSGKSLRRSDEHEAGPVRGRVPISGMSQVTFGRVQRFGDSQRSSVGGVLGEPLVKVRHQFGGAFVRDVPEAGDDLPSTGRQESLSQ